MEIANQFIAPGFIFSLTLTFGFWLSDEGKPYNGILFNLHKLLALGAVALVVVQFTKIPRPAESYGFVIGLFILAALCIIALFASGALMSAGKLGYALMLTIHRLAPIGLVGSLGFLISLLNQLP